MVVQSFDCFKVWILEQQEDEEMLVPHSDVVDGAQPMEGFFFFFIEFFEFTLNRVIDFIILG